MTILDILNLLKKPFSNLKTVLFFNQNIAAFANNEKPPQKISEAVL
jgi:hypothetical protein